MSGDQRRRAGVLTFLLGAALLGLASDEARGQWGWGFGAFNYVPQPIDFLNQQSLMNSARPGQAGPQQRLCGQLQRLLQPHPGQRVRPLL